MPTILKNMQKKKLKKLKALITEFWNSNRTLRKLMDTSELTWSKKMSTQKKLKFVGIPRKLKCTLAWEK